MEGISDTLLADIEACADSQASQARLNIEAYKHYPRSRRARAIDELNQAIRVLDWVKEQRNAREAREERRREA